MAKKAARQFLELVDIAEACDVSTRTVRRWIARGDLKAVRLSARVLRVEVTEFERFIDRANSSGAA